MGGRRPSLALVATVFFIVSSVAVAEPAGEPSFVPVGSVTTQEPGTTVVVVPGDHLWKISQARLDNLLGRMATSEEVAPYWREVIEVNRGRLLSSDPDLIYPGEVVLVPPTN
jgi:nucleoid-associated protein YgaU